MIQAFVLGKPGSGKTTISKLLQEKCKVVCLSTGDLLRDNISKRTPTGMEARSAIKEKKLVSDEIVVQMVVDRIHEEECQSSGWVIDGFPRTVDQAIALKKAGIVPNKVISLEIPNSLVEHRILGRRVDVVTGDLFHIEDNEPIDPEITERLQKRSDDTIEKLQHRMDAYESYGKNVLGYYEDCVHTVDADHRIKALYQIVYQSITQQNNENESSPSAQAMEAKDISKSIEFDENPEEDAKKHSNNKAVEIIAEIEEEAILSDCTSDNDDQPVPGNNLEAKFRARLRSGIEIIKHGRRGSPHARVLFCDEIGDRIFWQKTGLKELKPKKEQSISISEISAIVQGCETDVFKRSGNKNDSDKYVSLVAGERTLDMEAPSPEEASSLYAGFQSLVL